MKHLSTLTPGETLILQYGDKAPLNDLLKYTFMDLLLKEVITVEEVQRQVKGDLFVRSYKYISIGKKFHKHRPMSHEKVFLSIFHENTAIKILFRNLVKLAYEKSESAAAYHTYLTHNGNLKSSFSTTLYHKLFGGFNYTENGIRLKKEVQQELIELENSFSVHFAKNRIKGLEIIKMIGGNIFFVKGAYLILSDEIDKDIFGGFPKQAAAESGSGCWSSFDSSCSATHESGCSNNSGCSGCGGDSGCGGCGGD